MFLLAVGRQLRPDFQDCRMGVDAILARTIDGPAVCRRGASVLLRRLARERQLQRLHPLHGERDGGDAADPSARQRDRGVCGARSE